MRGVSSLADMLSPENGQTDALGQRGFSEGDRRSLERKEQGQRESKQPGVSRQGGDGYVRPHRETLLSCVVIVL